MDFFFFVISFNQSFFFVLSAFSVPVCVCMGFFSPRSFFFSVRSYSSEKKEPKFAFLHAGFFYFAADDGLAFSLYPQQHSPSGLSTLFLRSHRNFAAGGCWRRKKMSQTNKKFCCCTLSNIFGSLCPNFSSSPLFFFTLSTKKYIDPPLTELTLCTCWNFFFPFLFRNLQNDLDGWEKSRSAGEAFSGDLQWCFFFFLFCVSSGSIPTKKWLPIKQSTWPRASTSASYAESIFRVKAACGSTQRHILASVLLCGELRKLTFEPETNARKILLRLETWKFVLKLQSVETFFAAESSAKAFCRCFSIQICVCEGWFCEKLDGKLRVMGWKTDKELQGKFYGKHWERIFCIISHRKNLRQNSFQLF